MATRSLVAGAILLATLSIAAPAAAQRFAFERSYDVGQTLVIDVSTTRGKIHVRTGEPGRVVVTGAATVRIGLMAPSDAVERARRVAERPPIEQNGDRLQLRAPMDPDDSRAMTVTTTCACPRTHASSPSAIPARSTCATSRATPRCGRSRARSR